MTAIELEIEMVKRVGKALENLTLQKPHKKNETESVYDHVRVFAGFPPASERGKENEDVPFIALRASEGSDEVEQSTVKINMEIITYKNDDKEDGYIGHRNGLTIMERLRQNLRKKRFSDLYEYVGLKWEVLKLDGAFSGIAADITFSIPVVREEDTIIDDIIG